MTLNGDGSGKVVLAGTAQIIGASSSNVLENVNKTISGAGTISNLVLVNDAAGVIDANVSGQTLTVATGSTVSNDGLLAATAMQTAVGESTYPVLGSVKWLKTYQAAAATPLRPADIFHGHLLFTAMRLAMNCVIFVAVMAGFGAVPSAGVLAALPVAVLTGLAFAAPLEAYAVTRTQVQGSIIRAALNYKF